MIIHTVQPGETLEMIAEKYGIPVELLLETNQIINPNTLITGQSLLILFPKEIHTVQEGENLADIAARYGVSVMDLYRNNLKLFEREYIYPGENLVISFSEEKIMEISTNGYVFPFIEPNILRSTLPYLTYLTIFYYKITIEGGLIDIDDQELINTARSYGVAPVMQISTLTQARTTDVATTINILANPQAQESLINNVLNIMRTKGYYALNIDMQNIQPSQRQLFVNFIANISGRLRQEGYLLFITLTPNTLLSGTGEFYEGPEYSAINQYIDGAMLMSYQWGSVTSPQPALPLTQVRYYMDFAVSQIDHDKISLGIPVIGYIWQLPFVPGRSVANAISFRSVLSLALDVGVSIMRDPASEAPYFNYSLDTDYTVWYRDVRSIYALMEIVIEYGFAGIGIWNIMQFATGLWMLINTLFDIKKVDL